MALNIAGNVFTWYNEVFEKYRDRRMDRWPLMSSPVPAYFLTALYLLVVWRGPKWMASRPAYNISHLLVAYNFILVIGSIYMFWEFFATTILNPSFSKVCQPIDHSDDSNALRLANVCWLYFFSKIVEFVDTIAFILRKKASQITFLHVYHHSSMVLLWWIGARFVPGGESYLSAMINSFIHILMYFYYMMSAIGPSMQKYLWWKKYMTVLQLVQFNVIFGHTLYATYSDCGYPQPYNYALILYTLSHIALFTNFYRQSYTKKVGRVLQNGSDPNTKVHQNGDQWENGISTQNGISKQNGISTQGVNQTALHPRNRWHDGDKVDASKH